MPFVLMGDGPGSVDGRVVAETAAADPASGRYRAAVHNTLAVTAHELKTPLTALLAETEVLAGLVGEPEHVAECRQLLGGVAGNVRHLLRLVDDLTDWARIEHGQLDVLLEPLDVRDVVASVVDRLRPSFVRSGVALRSALPSAPVLVAADEGRLWQAIANLVVNAREVTPVGARVSVVVRRRDTRVLTQVIDHGRGLAETELARVLQPFERIGERGRGSGLGLGLSIARYLIDLHQGELRVASTTGHGSCFTIDLAALSRSPSPRDVATSND